MRPRPPVLTRSSLAHWPLMRRISVRPSLLGYTGLLAVTALASVGLACGGPPSAADATATVVAASTAIELTRLALPTRTATPPVTRTPTAGPGTLVPERTPAVAPPTRPTGG